MKVKCPICNNDCSYMYGECKCKNCNYTAYFFISYKIRKIETEEVIMYNKYILECSTAWQPKTKISSIISGDILYQSDYQPISKNLLDEAKRILELKLFW